MDKNCLLDKSRQLLTLAGVDESAAAALTRAGMSFDQGKSGVWRRIRESGYQSIHDFMFVVVWPPLLIHERRHIKVGPPQVW